MKLSLRVWQPSARAAHCASGHRWARGFASGLGGDSTGSSDTAGVEVSAIKMITKGLHEQTAGRAGEALMAYRRVQEAKPPASPLLRSLAGNAEGLLLLRSPSLLRHTSESATDGPYAPLESFKPGATVLAPWAEDGEEYAAVISTIDEATGECVVDWDDGGKTHRSVPLAALTTMQGGVCARALRHNPSEVGMWAARRALRRAFHQWEAQADYGTSHDAFVDMVGLLSDLAIAEAKAGLASPSRRWLTQGLDHARRHLQRARFSAERAYKPDLRALAVIYINRAELVRITAAATTGVWNAAAGSHVSEPLAELLQHHQTGGIHLAAATWKTQVESGRLKPSVVHELLWAKALASQAAVLSTSKPVKKPPAAARIIVKRQSVRKPRAPSHAFASLPEKLVSAPSPAAAAAQDPFLGETCPARAAAARAWRALCAAAGEPMAQEKAGGGLWVADAEVARRLASAVGEGSLQSQLLLEVAVLLMAMGCKLGRRRWARTVALSLVETAVKQLEALSVDDGLLRAARHTAAVLEGSEVPESPNTDISRDALLRTDVDCFTPSPWMNWRLVGYIPAEEIWIVRVGSRHTVHLAAPPPLSWCMEGLALSETLPDSK